MRIAEEVLQSLWRSDHVSARAVILVGNKVDLVRSRLVSTEGDDIFFSRLLATARSGLSSLAAYRHARTFVIELVLAKENERDDTRASDRDSRLNGR